MNATTNELVAQLSNFSHEAAGRNPSTIRPFAVHYLSQQVVPTGESVLIGLPGDVRLGSSGSAGELSSPAIQTLLEHPPARTVTEQTTLRTNGAFLLIASPMVENHNVLGTLIVSANLEHIQADQRSVLWLVFGEALVALVAAVVGTFLLLRRLLRTVGDITTTAQAIESGEIDQRLADPGTGDEVGQLAATFNSMLDKIDNAMTSQRQMLSDVSHQLRTPLTVARGQLEVLGRLGTDDPAEVKETIRVVIDELDHMRAMVEQLLLLGRSLEPDFLEVESLDVRSFIGELFESSQVLGQRRWSMDPGPDVVLEVDGSKLRGAVLNLLDNAVNATRTTDAIDLSASVSPRDGSVSIVVSDSGPGIPGSLRTASLSRFSRPGAADTEGSGLGLAIVKAVAEAHGGHVDLGGSPLGGCRAAIVLPSWRVAAVEPRSLAPAT